MIKSKLIGSAAHQDDIVKIISKYWYSNNIRLVEIVPMQWQVYQGEKRMEGFTVRLNKGRYRFEGVLNV